MNKMSAKVVSALMLVVSVAATFSGWLVLSVVRPVPMAQVHVSMPVTTLPVIMRDVAKNVRQPIAITRSSR